MTLPAQDIDAPGRRSLYLLTDQRVLLKGSDTGEARVTFAPVAVASTNQIAVSQ